MYDDTHNIILCFYFFVQMCSELEKDSVLTRDNIHLASSVDNCGLSNDGKALFFYAEPDSFQDSNNLISSRQVVIGPFDVDISQLSNQEEESVWTRSWR